MGGLVYLIASESHSDGGTSIVPFVLVGAGVVVAVLVQRSRVQKAKGRVNIRLAHDIGRVGLDPLPNPHSIAVGIRVRYDQSTT